MVLSIKNQWFILIDYTIDYKLAYIWIYYQIDKKAKVFDY